MIETQQNTLLRMEGVNLSSVLDDTPEISIRRGAGLMLRQAVKDISAKISVLKPISTGASSGLFQFYAADQEALNKIENKVVKQLNRDYPHLTFVVDTQVLQSDFKLAHETVIAKNRLRQFQQITLSTPAITEMSDYCKMTQLHPVEKGGKAKGQKISSSAYARFIFGQQQRQKFYQEEIGKPIAYDFTEDLSSLAEPTETQDFGNLNRKMAVIYLDGNKFGEIQKNCTTPEQLGSFDETVQNYRKQFLEALLDHAAANNAFKNRDQIRLETLLWGGDEMILVVPAWKGIEVLLQFYSCSKHWTFNETALTHAGGIVFSHHKTPIDQLIKTAKELADTVKIRRPKENRFDYLVLESIDYPTQSLKQFQVIQYGENARHQRQPLAPFSAEWSQLIPHWQEFQATLPRRPIYDIAQQWVNDCKKNAPNEIGKALEESLIRFKSVSPQDYQALFDKVFKAFSSEIVSADINQQKNNSGWLHLCELWDYLAPEGQQ